MGKERENPVNVGFEFGETQYKFIILKRYIYKLFPLKGTRNTNPTINTPTSRSWFLCTDPLSGIRTPWRIG